MLVKLIKGIWCLIENWNVFVIIVELSVIFCIGFLFFLKICKFCKNIFGVDLDNNFFFLVSFIGVSVVMVVGFVFFVVMMIVIFFFIVVWRVLVVLCVIKFLVLRSVLFML